MPTRWFVVPVVGDGTDDNPYRPKHADTPGIEGFSGTIIDFDAETFPSLPWTGTEQYVVQFRGSDSAISDAESNSDAYTMQQYPAIGRTDVAGYLNEAFGQSLTFDEYEAVFFS